MGLIFLWEEDTKSYQRVGPEGWLVAVSLCNSARQWFRGSWKRGSWSPAFRCLPGTWYCQQPCRWSNMQLSSLHKVQTSESTTTKGSRLRRYSKYHLAPELCALDVGFQMSNNKQLTTLHHCWFPCQRSPSDRGTSWGNITNFVILRLKIIS